MRYLLALQWFFFHSSDCYHGIISYNSHNNPNSTICHENMYRTSNPQWLMTKLSYFQWQNQGRTGQERKFEIYLPSWILNWSMLQLNVSLILQSVVLIKFLHGNYHLSNRQFHLDLYDFKHFCMTSILGTALLNFGTQANDFEKFFGPGPCAEKCRQAETISGGSLKNFSVTSFSQWDAFFPMWLIFSGVIHFSRLNFLFKL